jgi:c-di-GMP-binding flagellar brake protein YcgR
MAEGHSGSERRRHKRLSVNFTVIYRVNKPLEVRMMVGDKEVNALMIDLSEGGMCLLTDYNIPTGTVLFIKFTLINLNAYGNERVKSMEITGEVRYNLINPEHTHRLGIRFTEIDKKDQVAIIGFLNISGTSPEPRIL